MRPAEAVASGRRLAGGIQLCPLTTSIILPLPPLSFWTGKWGSFASALTPAPPTRTTLQRKPRANRRGWGANQSRTDFSRVAYIQHYLTQLFRKSLYVNCPHPGRNGFKVSSTGWESLKWAERKGPGTCKQEAREFLLAPLTPSLGAQQPAETYGESGPP